MQGTKLCPLHRLVMLDVAAPLRSGHVLVDACAMWLALVVQCALGALWCWAHSASQRCWFVRYARGDPAAHSRWDVVATDDVVCGMLSAPR
eukprot:9207669-Pyramimonas_sp.AAC.1